MGNCLITTLPSSVSDNTLRKFAVLNVKFTNLSFSSSAVLGVRTKSQMSVTGVSDDLYDQVGVNLGRVVSFGTSASSTWLCPGSGDVELSNKYDITYLSLPNAYIEPIDVADMQYCNELQTCIVPMKGDLSNLGIMPYVTNLDLRRPNESYDLVGTLSAFANLTSLTTLNLSKNRVITGNIADLGPLTSLTSLSLGDLNAITGTVEGFVAAQRSAGRTTCSSLSVPYIGSTPITFNGSSIVSVSQTTISWTENTITIGGTTINA